MTRFTADEPADVELFRRRLAFLQECCPGARAKVPCNHAEFMAEFVDQVADWVPNLTGLCGDVEAARRVMENDRKVMQSGVATELEEYVPMPDGTARVWLSRKAPYRDAAGRVVGLLGISRDITSRKRASSHAAFLNEASRALLSPQDPAAALGTVVELAVPAIADCAAVHLAASFVPFAAAGPGLRPRDAVLRAHPPP
jgi:hypothetical protein